LTVLHFLDLDLEFSWADGFMAARLAMSWYSVMRYASTTHLHTYTSAHSASGETAYDGDKTTPRGLHTATLVKRTNSTHHTEYLHAIMYLHPTPTSSANIVRSANMTQKLA